MVSFDRVSSCAGVVRPVTGRAEPPRRAAEPSGSVPWAARRRPPDARLGSRSSSILKAAERLETRVDVVGRVVVWAVVEPLAADGQRPGQSSRQSGAIGSASRIASRTGVSRSSSWWSVRRRVLGASSGRTGGAGVDVDRGQGLLLDRDRGSEPRCRGGSGCTGLDRGLEIGRDEQATVRPGEADPALDRIGQAEVLAEVDRGAGDVVVAGRTGVVGQEAGDVPDERRAEGSAGAHRRAELGLLVDVLGLLRRPAIVGVVGAVLLVGPEVGPALSSRSMPFLMLWSVLTTSPSSPTRHVDGVLVGAAADLLGVLLGLGDDAAALGLGLLGQPALVDEESGLLLGTGDDPLRLLLGLLDDPLALGVDPFGGADLLGDGDAELVDQAEGGGLVDDDVVRQGELLAVRDDRLEALDEEDDVDLGTLRLRATGTAGRWVDYGTAPGSTAVSWSSAACGPAGFLTDRRSGRLAPPWASMAPAGGLRSR